MDSRFGFQSIANSQSFQYQQSQSYNAQPQQQPISNVDPYLNPSFQQQQPSAPPAFADNGRMQLQYDHIQQQMQQLQQQQAQEAQQKLLVQQLRNVLQSNSPVPPSTSSPRSPHPLVPDMMRSQAITSQLVPQRQQVGLSSSGASMVVASAVQASSNSPRGRPRSRERSSLGNDSPMSDYDSDDGAEGARKRHRNNTERQRRDRMNEGFASLHVACLAADKSLGVALPSRESVLENAAAIIRQLVKERSVLENPSSLPEATAVGPAPPSVDDGAPELQAAPPQTQALGGGNLGANRPSISISTLPTQSSTHQGRSSPHPLSMSVSGRASPLLGPSSRAGTTVSRPSTPKQREIFIRSNQPDQQQTHGAGHGSPLVANSPVPIRHSSRAVDLVLPEPAPDASDPAKLQSIQPGPGRAPGTTSAAALFLQQQLVSHVRSNSPIRSEPMAQSVANLLFSRQSQQQEQQQQQQSDQTQRQFDLQQQQLPYQAQPQQPSVGDDPYFQNQSIPSSLSSSSDLNQLMPLPSPRTYGAGSDSYVQDSTVPEFLSGGSDSRGDQNSYSE